MSTDLKPFKTNKKITNLTKFKIHCINMILYVPDGYSPNIYIQNNFYEILEN